MPTLSRLLILTGLLSLFHAAYSAHESSSLLAAYPSAISVPLDIQLETVISVLLCCAGLVLGSEPLRPISWNAWAGEIEKHGRHGRGGAANPFKALEERRGFMDIRAKRKEFADWVRDKDGVGKSQLDY